MKHQALFSSKDKSQKKKVSSAAKLLRALRVKRSFCTTLIGHLNRAELSRAIQYNTEWY